MKSEKKGSPAVKKHLLRILFFGATELFFIVFIVIIYMLKPIWFGVDAFIIGAVGVKLPWIRLIIIATLGLMVSAGAGLFLLLKKRGKEHYRPGILGPAGLCAACILWGGMLAMLILQAGEVFLLPTLRYYLYETGPWAGMGLSCAALVLVSYRIYRTARGPALRRFPFTPGSGFALLGVLLLFVFSFNLLRERDRRRFPHDRPPAEPVDYVNPLSGTHGPYEYGATDPLTAVPFGMTHWTPMTQEIKLGKRAYRYYNRTIGGFLATHRPAVWMGDYGQWAFMPGSGPLRVRFGERSLRFRHRDETVSPCYYRVPLRTSDGGVIIAEMTVTERCGILRFTYPKNRQSQIVVEASMNPRFKGLVRIDPGRGEISGYNSDRYGETESRPLEKFRCYYVMKTGKKIRSHGTWTDGTVRDGAGEQEGSRIGAWMSFPTEEGETVEVRVGTSFISLEQARENMKREIEGRDFASVIDRARTLWRQRLAAVTIEGATNEQKGIFYTGLYRCLLFPREFSEYGRYYSAFDEKIHNGISYSDYSLWDTFRAEHPLLILIAPEKVPGMITALLQMYEEGGWMPKWPNPGYTNIMIGTHADAVIADAYVKGVRGFDAAKAYRAMYKNAMVPPDGDRHKRWADRDPWTSYEARGGLSWYKELGYVPADKTAESVSRTIEFSYGDFCVAVMAKALGKAEDHRLFMKRSGSYRRLYHAEQRFMAPRNADGSWHPYPHEGFTEGDPWTYLFGALHDPAGMMELMGGREAFIKRLDENFNGGHYVHENEPGHHYIYLYDYAGVPWKTQERARYYCETKYKNGPAGLPGDEDCGQMSAWYVFSAMGFYPACPGTDEYALGSPLFRKTTITMADGKRFEIVAKDISPENRYVQSARLNGTVLKTPFIRHGDIVRGGQLELVMGPSPVR